MNPDPLYLALGIEARIEFELGDSLNLISHFESTQLAFVVLIQLELSEFCPKDLRIFVKFSAGTTFLLIAIGLQNLSSLLANSDDIILKLSGSSFASLLFQVEIDSRSYLLKEDSSVSRVVFDA